MAQVSTPTYRTVVTDIDGNITQSNGERMLSSTDSVNLNTTNKTTLFTVPAGKSCVITRVVVRAASTNLTTASFGFGFNANADDVDASSVHATLTGATIVDSILPLTGAVRGAAADAFGVKCSIAQGAPATVSVDVFGYLY